MYHVGEGERPDMCGDLTGLPVENYTQLIVYLLTRYCKYLSTPYPTRLPTPTTNIYINITIPHNITVRASLK